MNKCPFCKKEGKKSRLYPGMSKSTLVGYSPYYDEDGHCVSNNPNYSTTTYSCSNGHRFEAKERGSEVLNIRELPKFDEEEFKKQGGVVINFDKDKNICEYNGEGVYRKS